MQDFNQNRKGRSLRKYCSDEGGDYKRLSEYKRLARIQRRAIHMTMTIDDPKFIASWQNVKECLKCLDEVQVERLFSKEHASLLEFNQALADELRLKEASLRSTVSALKADCEAVKNEISEIRDETRQLREERKLMELEIEVRKRQIASLRSVRKTTI